MTTAATVRVSPDFASPRAMRPIPGPANAFASRENIAHARANGEGDEGAREATPNDATSSNPAATAEDVLDAALFASAPWRRALDAIDVENFDPNRAECKYNVAWLRRGGWRSGRAPRVAGALRELGATSNGDGAGTLCDPTGEIRVIVHRELMMSERALASGCAVVLRDVPVLSVDATAHALAVTSENLVAVFEADVDAYAASAAKRTRIEREALRERLRESAVIEAVSAVDWEDFEDVAGAFSGYGGDAPPSAEIDHNSRDEVTVHTDEMMNDVTTAPTPDGPSDFALQLAALYADDGDA